jgi:hypothetical protein
MRRRRKKQHDPCKEQEHHGENVDSQPCATKAKSGRGKSFASKTLRYHASDCNNIGGCKAHGDEGSDDRKGDIGANNDEGDEAGPD